MKRAIWLLAVTACFDPRARSRATIDAGVDDALTDDAAISTANDRDGDLVTNDRDNCPDKANPDQGDEDKDLVGDACDPCPIDVNNTTDPDADGVAGSCDPHPNTAGDKLVVFEGFHRALAATWTTIGGAAQADDQLVITTAVNNHVAVIPPITTIANGMIMASFVVDATTGTTDSLMALTMPYDPGTDDGIYCELYAPNAGSTNGRYVSLYDSKPDVERAVRGFVWSTATPYRVSLTRTNTSYVCSVTPTGATAQVASGSSSTTLPTARPALWALNANVHVAWLLVVSSP